MTLNKQVPHAKPFHKNIAFIFATALSLSMVGINGHAAEEDLAETERQDPEQALRLQGIYKAEHLLDKPVKNPNEEDLGEISEIVMDGAGQIKYAVLSYGGLLGMGKKMTAVSWELLQISPDDDHYILNLDVSREQLTEQAPTFSDDHWPTEAQLTEFTRFEPRKRKENHQEDRNNST
jgi:hypothetical protein